MSEFALITGATSGIGSELARVLAANGHNIIISGRNREALEELRVELLTGSKVKVIDMSADLSKPDEVEALAARIQNQSLIVDILINNAGFGAYGKFQNSEWKTQSDMIAVNMHSVLHLTHVLLPDMIKNKKGRIMNVASTAAFQPGPLMSVYYASKAFVLHFSEALASELKGTGISVTALCPGPTATGFQKAANFNASRLIKLMKSASAREVAEYGYTAMMKGKRIAIPGVLNMIGSTLPRILPRRLVTFILHKIQDTTKK